MQVETKNLKVEEERLAQEKEKLEALGKEIAAELQSAKEARDQGIKDMAPKYTFAYSYLPPELKQSQTITAAAINNYVRTKMLPEPRKKKYYRVHIAYLLMICTLKQTLSLSMLQTLLPGDLPEDEVKRAYTAYVLRHRLCAQYFIDQVKLSAANMLDPSVTSELAVQDTTELIASAAILSGLSRLFAEKLLLLKDKTLETGGSIEILE